MTRDNDAVLTAKTDRLRDDSGHVADDNSVVTFLYLLARDHLPMGEVEKIMGQVLVAEERGVAIYTNGWLALWAQNAAGRLDPAPV